MGDFFLNLFRGCIKMSTQQPFKSSLQEENSPDVTGDDFVKELLLYFRGFQYINDTEDDIKQICFIERDKKVWSLDEIKKAWEEAKRLSNIEKQDWSHVILLQELKRRVCNDKGKRSMPGNVLEEDVDCVKGSRKRHKSNRSSESNTEPKRVVDDASQAAEDLKNKLIIEEQLGENLSQQPCHILIPLSVMSENEPTTIQDAADTDSTPYTKYKLKDGVPYSISNSPVSKIRKKKSYVMSYNNDTNNADWTYEILNASTLANNCLELNFNGTNYHKGHLAAAANHNWCLEAKNDASLFSNLTPQHKDLNNRVWKSLENHCRSTAKERTGCNVHVYTGPLYLNPSTGLGGKALPSHFFKVMFVENERGIVEEPVCYRMPNTEINITDFRDITFKSSIDDIERESGLTFVEPTPTTPIRNIIKMINWEGTDADEQLRSANIKVRIIS